MGPTFIPAARLSIVPGKPVEVLANGSIRSLPGNHGFVFYGPYREVQSGIYRIVVRLAGGDQNAKGYWEAYAGGQVFSLRRLSDRDAIVWLPDTSVLETRLAAEQDEFTFEGVDIEPVCLDRAEAGVAELRKLIDHLIESKADSRAILHLADRLARLGATRTADELAISSVESRRDAHARVNAILKEINTVGRREPSTEPRTPPTFGEIGAVVARHVYTTIDLFALEPKDLVQLERWGYSLPFLQATCFDHSRRDEAPRVVRAPEESSGPRSELFRQLDNVDLSFQFDLASGKGMQAYCPISGRALVSHHGFSVHFGGMPFVLYRFEGTEVFYIGAGNFSGSKMFVYLPTHELVVFVQQPSLRWYPAAEILRQFKTNLAAWPCDVFAYLRSETRPAALLSNNNLGHFFWNNLGGLNRAHDAGLFPGLESVVKLPAQYIEVERVFPELSTKNVSFLKNDMDAFVHCLRNSCLPICFTDTVITSSLSERLRIMAARNATPEHQPPADLQRPLVWINLRAHNKSWINQQSGYVDILNAACAEFGPMSILLDGLPDCEEVASGITSRLRPEIKVYSGLSFTMFDSLHWAFLSDTYICTIGSGLVLLSWIANKPGVAHANLVHMEQMSWWCDARPGAVEPLVPALPAIVDPENKMYSNYDIDSSVLLDLLRTALEKAGFDRLVKAA